MRRLSPNSFRNQRGAIGLFGVLTLLLAVLFTALAVDSGRLWMQQRKLQSIADIAAIQASRQLGCSASLNDVMAAAQAAAANNGFAGQLSQGPNLVDLGSVTTSAGIREFTSGASAEAVFVRATQEVPSSLVAGGLFGGTVTLHAEAVSLANPPLAAFSAGSFLVSLNSQDSALLNGLLGGMLGSSLSLSAVSYQGIANTQVSLLDLIKAKADVGTVEELLETDIQVGELLGLFASAMNQSGTASADAVLAAQQIASAAVNDVNLRLGDVLAVTSPDMNAAANVGLNALSLITTTAIVANGQHALTVPLGINVPPIASINALVTVIEPPQLAIGPAAASDGTLCTEARTAQVRVTAGVLVNVLGLARLDLALRLQVAQGRAGLTRIDVGDGATNLAIDATPGIASLALTNNANTGPARISLLLGLLPLADIGLNLPIQNPSPTELEFDVQHPAADNLPQMQSVASSVGGSLQNALSQPNAISVTVLSILNLGLVNNIVGSIVSPLLGALGSALLDPLLKLLGIQLGGLDITVEDIQLGQPKPLVI